MKRIIYIIAVILAVATVFGGITVFADSSEDNLTRDTTYVENETNKNDISGEEVTDNIVTDDATNNDDIVTNSFEAVFETVKKYATEIFCALSFIGSLILAYAYRSGLLPIIKSGIGAISDVVSRIKETTERGESKTDEIASAVCGRLSNAEACLDNIENAIDVLGERLDLLSKDADERKKLRVILSAQIDMLYSIFMTSALPQYQKDEVGMKISEMREALLGNEDE